MAGKTTEVQKPVDPKSFKEEDQYKAYEKVEGMPVDYSDKQNGRRESATLKNLDVKGPKENE